MTNWELEFKYEVLKRWALKKIADARQKWEECWAKAEGIPEAEVELLSLKIDIDIMEKDTLFELEKFEKEMSE